MDGAILGATDGALLGATLGALEGAKLGAIAVRIRKRSGSKQKSNQNKKKKKLQANTSVEANIFGLKEFLLPGLVHRHREGERKSLNKKMV